MTLESVVKKYVPFNTTLRHPSGTVEFAEVDIWSDKTGNAIISTDSGVCIGISLTVAYHLLIGELPGYDMARTA